MRNHLQDCYRPIVMIFLVILTISAISMLRVRDRIFQETDSELSYRLMTMGSDLVIKTNGVQTYAGQVWNTGESQTSTSKTLKDVLPLLPDALLSKALHNPLVAAKIAKLRPDSPPPEDSAGLRTALDEIMAKKPMVAETPLHGLWRIGLGMGIEQTHLPPVIKRALLFPLSSTYTPVMGLSYSLIYEVYPDYNGFLYLSQILTITLFHISAFLLFLTFLRLKYRGDVAVLTSLLYLYGATASSYAFHLGSTVWCLLVFTWIACRVAGESQRKSLILLCGGLVFVHYLAILVLIGLSVPLLWQNLRQHGLIRGIFRTIGDSWAGVALAALCLILFIQPGQGIRGRMRTWSELPDYIRDILLNLLAISDTAFTIQLPIIIGLVAAAVFFLLKNWREKQNLFPITILSTYFVLLASGLMNVSPSRHILFILPALYLSLGNVFQHSLNRLPVWAGRGAIMLLLPLCLLTRENRLEHLTSPAHAFHLPPHAGQAAFVFDSGIDLALRHGLTLLPSPEPTGSNGSFVYISQKASVEDWLSWPENQALAAQIDHIAPLLTAQSAYSFMAKPPFYGDERFAFNRNNNAYIAIISLGRKE